MAHFPFGISDTSSLTWPFVAGAAALAASPANAPGITVPPPMPLPLVLGPPLGAEPAAALIASTAAAWIIAGTYTVPPANPVPWS